MAGDLGWAPHEDVARAERVLETGVGPLDEGADAVAHAGGFDMAGGPPRPGLLLEGLLERAVATRVEVDDRDMAETLVGGVDLTSVIGVASQTNSPSSAVTFQVPNFKRFVTDMMY